MKKTNDVDYTHITVTVLGSSKLKDEKQKVAATLDMCDMTVLGARTFINSTELTEYGIELMNRRYKRHIDMSDLVIAVIKNHVIGENIKKKMEYANSIGKIVFCGSSDEIIDIISKVESSTKTMRDAIMNSNMEYDSKYRVIANIMYKEYYIAFKEAAEVRDIFGEINAMKDVSE